jgi:hypothetical protein
MRLQLPRERAREIRDMFPLAANVFRRIVLGLADEHPATK